MQANEKASKKIIDETRRLYSSLMPTRTKLEDRQLERPTFNFIHEFVRNVVAETKILRDVYNPNELQPPISSNITSQVQKRGTKNWDRRAKVEFIQKLIEFVAINKEPVLGCTASKVVSGSDPNKTNELLQGLARIASKRSFNKKQTNKNQSLVSSATSQGSSNRSSASSIKTERPRTFTRNSPRNSRSSISTTNEIEDVTKSIGGKQIEKQFLEANDNINETKRSEEKEKETEIDTTKRSSISINDSQLNTRELERIKRGLNSLQSWILNLNDEEDSIRSYIIKRLEL